MKCGECVTELVPGTCIDRPFLGECVNPILTVPVALKILNVLHDSEFLIVGFLDKETVVLNLRRVIARSFGRFGGIWRLLFLSFVSARALLHAVGMDGSGCLCQRSGEKECREDREEKKRQAKTLAGIPAPHSIDPF